MGCAAVPLRAMWLMFGCDGVTRKAMASDELRRVHSGCTAVCYLVLVRESELQESGSSVRVAELCDEVLRLDRAVT